LGRRLYGVAVGITERLRSLDDRVLNDRPRSARVRRWGRRWAWACFAILAAAALAGGWYVTVASGWGYGASALTFAVLCSWLSLFTFRHRNDDPNGPLPGAARVWCAGLVL